MSIESETDPKQPTQNRQPSVAEAPLSFWAVARLVGYVIAFTVLLVVGIFVARLVFGASDEATTTLIAAMLPIHGLGVVLIIKWQLARHGKDLSSVGAKKPTMRMLHLLWQVPTMWVALIVSIGIMLPLLESYGDPTDGGAESTMAQVSAPLAVAVFVGTAILAPLWEEFFFRGIVHQGLRARFGVVTSVLLSSLLFTLIHSVLLMVLYFFVMAVAMALIYEFHKNIWAPVVAHAAINAPISGIALLTVLSA